MLSFRGPSAPLCDGTTRREWLRVGGLGILGLSLSDLMGAGQLVAATPADPLAGKLSGSVFGRAKNVIFLWLQGGPPQHETFDPKPNAPAEIRGQFAPIQTNVPGMHFCELLPRTAKRADKLAVIRSLCTDDNNHDVSGYWILTGYPYGLGSARQIKPSDWPYFGSIIKMKLPSAQLPALTSVWLPDRMRLNDNVTPAGQTGGFLGGGWDPERFVGDPANEDYRIDSLALPIEIPSQRMLDRGALLQNLDQSLRQIDRAQATSQWDQNTTFALEMVTSGKARVAFDLAKEPAALRDRYGRHTWGQSCLLARRLIEAGVRLVHVNWPREPGDNAVDNPMWDTHTQNADRLQDVLCPIFDHSFAALLDDLGDRGLLEETLVVAIGEFGRTPKINQFGGRDHWGPVFCCALAGAGISGGQIFGASDKNGAYPVVDPIRPHDLTATIFHLLGIPHDGVFHDRSNRPHPLTKGTPLYRLLGNAPATMARCESNGDESFVPPYDMTLLVDTDFRSGKLVSVSPPSRAKGWRASPIARDSEPGLFVAANDAGVPHVRLGLSNVGQNPKTISINPPSKIILAQELRNARGGHYRFSVQLVGRGTSPAVFERWFGGALKCRLVLYRYLDTSKNPLQVEELASETITPGFGEEGAFAAYSLSKSLVPSTPGTNFSTGNGLGVAVVIDVTTDLEIPPGESAYLALGSAAVEFRARERDENVTV